MGNILENYKTTYKMWNTFISPKTNLQIKQKGYNTQEVFVTDLYSQ